VKTIGREVSERDVMQSDGIVLVNSDRHIRTDLSSMRENVCKTRKRIMAHLEYIVGRLKVCDGRIADVTRKYERIVASIPKKSLVGGV
jgi:hypothetical protein